MNKKALKQEVVEVMRIHSDMSISFAPLKEQQSCNKREWVSLTAEEKDSLLLPFGSYWVIDAIEAKLKEKNGV